MYLSYEDYQTMGGTLEETAFDDLAFEAGSVIDWYTFGRLRDEEYENLPADVKRCVYRLIQLIQEQQAASAMAQDEGEEDTAGITATIASQSNDGVSVSYNVMSAKDALDNAKSAVETTIKQYLSYVKNSLGRKVLYRGWYPGE